eukprot:1358937-Amorphochlora_amoeboformis.AAC.1
MEGWLEKKSTNCTKSFQSRYFKLGLIPFSIFIPRERRIIDVGRYFAFKLVSVDEVSNIIPSQLYAQRGQGPHQ